MFDSYDFIDSTKFTGKIILTSFPGLNDEGKFDEKILISQLEIFSNNQCSSITSFVEDKEFGSKFENLISKHDILITRNHGYYTVGKTAAEAFFRAYYLEQACSVQVKNLAMGLNKHEIDKQKAAYFWENMSDSDDYNYDGKTEWAALLRKLEREHSNYKN